MLTRDSPARRARQVDATSGPSGVVIPIPVTSTFTWLRVTELLKRNKSPIALIAAGRQGDPFPRHRTATIRFAMPDGLFSSLDLRKQEARRTCARWPLPIARHERELAKPWLEYPPQN